MVTPLLLEGLVSEVELSAAADYCPNKWRPQQVKAKALYKICLYFGKVSWYLKIKGGNWWVLGNAVIESLWKDHLCNFEYYGDLRKQNNKCAVLFLRRSILYWERVKNSCYLHKVIWIFRIWCFTWPGTQNCVYCNMKFACCSSVNNLFVEVSMDGY